MFLQKYFGTALLWAALCFSGVNAACAESSWSPAGQNPIVVPPISFIDVNSGRFGKLEINLEDGQFQDASVDNLHLLARKLDLAQGELNSLNIEIKGGHFQDFTIDQLTLSTSGSLRFDTVSLLNHRVLQFIWPATAQVTAVVSQASLNRFLNSPMTLSRLSAGTQQKASLLNNMLGTDLGVGVQFLSSQLNLQKDNRLHLVMQTKVGMGELALPIPFELDTQLLLKDGWVTLNNTRLSTNGQEISQQLSSMVVNKINSLADWGQQSRDINFTFTDLKVYPGDRFVLRGTAELYRLRFGRN